MRRVINRIWCVLVSHELPSSRVCAAGLSVHVIERRQPVTVFSCFVPFQSTRGLKRYRFFFQSSAFEVACDSGLYHKQRADSFEPTAAVRSSGDLLRVVVGSPDEPNPRKPRKVALAPVTRERAVGPAFPSTPIRHRCSVRSPGSGACAACQRPGSAGRQGGLPAGGACAPGRPAVPCASKARSVASLSLPPTPPAPPLPVIAPSLSPTPSATPGSLFTRTVYSVTLGPTQATRDAPPISGPSVTSAMSPQPRQGANAQLSGIGRWRGADGGGGVFYLPRWAGPPGRPLSLGCTSSTLIH